jgi:limonene-1,2-epoxide hydrolase
MFIETLGDVLPGFVSINMEIRRIVGYGHIVMLDRYDRMTGVDEAHSMNFEVVGLVRVQEGKLSVLRDFPIPGGVFDLGSAWLE